MNSEIRLYEALGIRIFQKLVFRLERFRHRADGDRNVNYHLLPYGETSPERFIRYLYLNAGIHISGLAATIVFSLIFAVMPGTLPTVWAVCFVGVIGNIYCIMLQRYNYLRIMRILKRQEERLALRSALWKERTAQRLSNADDPALRRKGIRCLRRMREDLARQGYTVISGSDEKTIQYLAEVSGARPAARKERSADIPAGTDAEPAARSVRSERTEALWRPQMVPYTAKERKAEYVMRFLGKPVQDPPVSVFFAGSEETITDLRKLFETVPAAGTDEILKMTEQMLAGQGGEPEGAQAAAGGEPDSIQAAAGRGPDSAQTAAGGEPDGVQSAAGREPDGTQAAAVGEQDCTGGSTGIGPDDAEGSDEGWQELGYDRKGLPYNIFRENALSVLQPGKKRKMKPDARVQAILKRALSGGRITPAGVYALRNEEDRELCGQIILRLFMYCNCDLTEELRDPQLKSCLETLTGEYLRQCRGIITSAKRPASAREEDERRMAELNCMYLSRKAREYGLGLSEHVFAR